MTMPIVAITHRSPCTLKQLAVERLRTLGHAQKGRSALAKLSKFHVRRPVESAADYS